MNKVQKTVSAIATLGVVAGITVAFNASQDASAWGDSEGGRKTYTLEQIQNGESGSAIFFNSITNSTIGDERNFVGAREDTGVNAGKDNVWNANEITVESGKTYIVRLYVHNNNPYGYNGVAENVKVNFALSKNYATENAITGYISSSNATPNQYWDSVVFKSSNGQSFYLDYVEGSAKVENNSYGQNGYTLSDDIILNAGATLGYDQPGDGKIPGCYQYAQYVTIRVKPVFTDENYIVEKTVRHANSDDKTWYESIYANVGDVVEYQIHYKNTTEGKAENVVVSDNLPSNLTVASAPILYNKTTTSNGKKGLELADFTKEAVSIGGYGINGEGYVRFTATVTDTDLICGKNILRNWTKVSVANVYKTDSADVIVEKTCETTTVKTRWILEDGTVLKDWIDGSFPDEEGDDYPEYEFVHYYSDKEGNITNVYRKKEEAKKVYTKWILEDGTVLKDWTEGTYPDKEGDDYPEYEFVKYYTDENGNTINVYKKKTVTPEKTPEALPKTGPVAGSILGAGSLVTALGYFIASRRNLR